MTTKKISAGQLDLEAIRDQISSEGVEAEIVDDDWKPRRIPSWGYVRAHYPQSIRVAIFFIFLRDDDGAPAIRLRAIALPGKSFYDLNEEEVYSFVRGYNQNAEFFGSVSLTSLHGLTTEYVLPYDNSCARLVAKISSEMARSVTIIKNYLEKNENFWRNGVRV